MRLRSGWLLVGVLALAAVVIGGCKGETPQEQAKSAATIAGVLTARGAAVTGVMIEAYFDPSLFKTHYRVWYRLPELALADQPSNQFRETTGGTNCGTFGGEPSLFGNSRPAELRRDNDRAIGYLAGRAPDGKDAAFLDYVWFHPHPPCGDTPDHKDATISITLANPHGSFTCTYLGAATGKGECKDNK